MALDEPNDSSQHGRLRRAWSIFPGRGGGGRKRPVPTTRVEGVTPIFFVVGCGKSGTSWLMNLLNSHPAILCHGEGRFFGTRHRIGAADSRSLEDALLESDELRDWARRSGWSRGVDYEAWVDECIPAIIGVRMGAKLAASGKEVVGDKTPLNGEGVVAKIGTVMPQSPIIHIIRDGRDVAVSSVHHRWNALADGSRPSLSADEAAVRDSYRSDPDGFRAAGRSIFDPGGVEPLARNWAELTNAAGSEGRALGPDCYCEVKYEDLLDSGPPEVVRLCGFLGVETSAAQAEGCIAANRFDHLTGGRTAGEEDSSAFLRSGKAGSWREVFTEGDIESFRHAAGDALVGLGYR